VFLVAVLPYCHKALLLDRVGLQEPFNVNGPDTPTDPQFHPFKPTVSKHTIDRFIRHLQGLGYLPDLVDLFQFHVLTPFDCLNPAILPGLPLNSDLQGTQPGPSVNV